MDTESKRLRIYEQLPVVICEWHQHVLPHIHRAIASRHLPANGLKMLHFDAHPDLTFPLNMTASDCFSKHVLYAQLEIADWILPLMFAGHINKLVWMKQSWAQQIKDGKYRVKVGEDKKTSQLRTTWKDDYFVEELLYSKEEDLINTKDVEIQVRTSNCELKSAENSFEPNCTMEGQNGIAKEALEEKKDYCRTASDSTCEENEIAFFNDQESFILDIDLDYFSTYNPFRLQNSEQDIAILAEIYKFQAPKSSNDEDIAAAIQQRYHQLQGLQKTFRYFIQDKMSESSIPSEFLNLISPVDVVKKSEIHEQLFDLLLKIQRKLQGAGNEIDLELIHYAGMSSELPHHRSTQKEINQALQAMKICLESIPKPLFITLARSSEDEYTPPDQVNYIQEQVLLLLKKLYGHISIIEDFETIDATDGSVE